MNEKAHSRSSRQRSLRRFVQTHDRLLSFVGALIVFVTYVVKEGFRDSLKEKLDALQNEKTTYELQSNANTILGTVQGIDSMLQPIFQRQVGNGAQPGTLGGDPNLVKARAVAFDREYDKHVLDSLTPLAAALGRKQDEGALKHLTAQFEHAGEPLKAANEAIAGRSDIAGERLAGASSEVQALSQSVQRFRYDLLEYAERETQRAESSYHLFIWLSYGLYPLGWGLGLIGRLYNVEGLGGES